MLLSLGSVSVAYTSGNITNIGIEPLDVKDYFTFIFGTMFAVFKNRATSK